MSDAAITIVMAGVVQLGLGILTYYTLRAKLKYSTEQNEMVSQDAMAAVRKADSAVASADKAVEKADTITNKADATAKLANKVAIVTAVKVGKVLTKLDDNTELTRAMSEVIARHGAADLVGIRDGDASATKHDLRGALNVVSLKLDRILETLNKEKP